MHYTTLPAGKYLIEAVQYDGATVSTKLILLGFPTVYMSIADTQTYNPKKGDYFVVDEQGKAHIHTNVPYVGDYRIDINTMDFSTLEKRILGRLQAEACWPTYSEIMAGLKKAGVLKPQVSATYEGHEFKFSPFDLSGAVKPAIMADSPLEDTKGMREENGFVGKSNSTVGDTKARYKTETESATASARDLNHLLSEMDAQVWATEFTKLNSASDHGTMLTWFACAIMTGFDEANRHHDKEREKLQNVIKSLTAQNTAKQNTISSLMKQSVGKDTRINGLHEQINNQTATTQKHQAQVQGLRDQINVQATDGNWDYDEYMRGMLNGLLCAMSNFDGKDPVYKTDLDIKSTMLNKRHTEANKSKAFNVLRKAAKMSPGTAATLVDALADAKLL